MIGDISTPWHAESYRRFIDEGLPQLLAERLPLTSYRTAPEDGTRVRVAVQIAGRVELAFVLPRPDERGVFSLAGASVVVFPIASSEELDRAEVRCVGEQLHDAITARLGEAPPYLSWDETLARGWLPLDGWVRDFLTPQPNDFGAHWATAQYLDGTNWLASATLLRRLIVREPRRLMTPGQIGRVCPYEVPEGPNMGRIYTIALGATIRDGRLVVVDERPEATLGLSAACVPLLEHNEYPRQLMGVNMMRQWLPTADPEPALVQTGNEPPVPSFWCGRNLLTAYLSWGADAFEDGLVLSESAARRLGGPAPAEPGDKLSNRHGTKGVVSKVLPDDQMPHLADGTAVEMIVSFMGLPSRLNVGQVREAVLGRVARAEGRALVVPPFVTPTAEAIRSRLRRAGLPESGMERLALGRGGRPLAQPSTVGWVYWGRLVHTAASKLRVFTGDEGTAGRSDEAENDFQRWPGWTPAGQRQSELEYYALRLAGAVETIREQFNTRAATRPDAVTLAARLAAGPVAQADAPTPMLTELTRRLDAAGVRATFEEGGLRFAFGPPLGVALTLAQPVPHPWLPERELAAVGALPALPQYATLLAANERLGAMLAGGAPPSLLREAHGQLAGAVAALLDALLPPQALWFDGRAIFSARTVAAPGGAALRHDQVGLPDEVAWALFGPLAAREGSSAEGVRRRDEGAAAALDAVMARSWVLVGRAPSLQPEAFLAFRPLRMAERVVRLPTLACNLLNADFDGDQVAVFLPVTAAGQREAEGRLSIAAHLTRDPTLVGESRPRMDALLGLAYLSLSNDGRAAIENVVGSPVMLPDGFLTRWVLADLLEATLAREGAGAALDVSERLTRLGFETAQGLGVSLSPFVGAGWQMPQPPAGDDPAAWEAYVEEVIVRYGAERDYGGDFGGLVLTAKSGARSNGRLVAWLVGARGAATNAAGERVALRHNHRDGLTLPEVLAITAESRDALAQLNHEWETTAEALRTRFAPVGYGVLARAMRTSRPGLVFALAAAAGETDPLHDIDSRLFVGLPPQ